MKKRKLKVPKRRQVNMYAELRHASHVLMHQAIKDQSGSFYQVMGSLIFTAFMVEAYLNHVGPHVFKCWCDLERLSPLSKLNLIVERLGIEKDDGKRPYQTLIGLFRFRNTLAHGKSVHLKSEEVRFFDESSVNDEHEFLRTDWEDYCSEVNAKRALEDAETIVRQIEELTGTGEHDPFPFFTGLHETSSSLIPEEQSAEKAE